MSAQSRDSRGKAELCLAEFRLCLCLFGYAVRAFPGLGGVALGRFRYEGTRVWPSENADDELAGYDPASSWPYRPPSWRRRFGGFLVFMMMMGGLGLLGWAGEVRYHFIERLTARATGTAPSSRTPAREDPRLETFLADGERALAEGDLDRAQSDFDKASVLDERSPAVLLGQARAASAKADIAWLRLRLLGNDAAAVYAQRIAKAQLGEAAAIARRAAEEAIAAAPTDAQALRVLLDALRISGDLDAARAHVVAVFATASEPQTAYVLGALDMAQADPPWSAVIARLRLAASGPDGAKARAALVYALAESGDLAGAKTELAKLDGTPRPYPLLADLHALVARGTGGQLALGVAAASASGAPADAPSATSAAPLGAPGTAAASGTSAVSGAAPVAATPGQITHEPKGSALEAATEAVRRAEFDRAAQIYQGILASNPNDSQAISGLADIARTRGDTASAIASYRRAIAINPSYLPALLGLADVEWSSGDRAAAVHVYREIVGRFPEGTYPSYAVRRANGE
jgi:tetratricopeptide (TPR) repeat protein